MKKLTLTLALLLMLSLCSCVTDDGATETEDDSGDTSETTEADSDDASETTEADYFQIPLPNENSDVVGECDYSKFSVKKPGGDIIEVDDDVSLINAINYLIRRVGDDLDRIEMTVYFNTNGNEALLDVIDYAYKEPIYELDYASGGRHYLLHIECEKIDIEAMKALTLEEEVNCITIDRMEIALPK